MRQIILDTESTGIDPQRDHRIIEIAALELVDRRPTGRVFHRYLNPGRPIDAAAEAVHGIRDTMLQGKETFADIADELLEFLGGAELVIHHAPFDIGFLNAELGRLGVRVPAHAIEQVCTVLDTFQLARTLRPGEKNDLESLCRHYGIALANVPRLNALTDVERLAQVYLTMTAGNDRLISESEGNPLNHGGKP